MAEGQNIHLSGRSVSRSPQPGEVLLLLPTVERWQPPTNPADLEAGALPSSPRIEARASMYENNLIAHPPLRLRHSLHFPIPGESPVPGLRGHHQLCHGCSQAVRWPGVRGRGGQLQARRGSALTWALP